MFVSHRQSAFSSLEAKLERHEALSPLARVRFMRAEGVAIEDDHRVKRPRSPAPWDTLAIVLEAETLVRCGSSSATVAAGDAAVMAGDVMRARIERGSSSAIIVEWDPDLAGESRIGSLTVSSLSLTLIDRARDVATLLGTRSAPGEEVAATVADLFAAMRAEGVPVRALDRRELIEPSSAHRGVGRALDTALACQSSLPAAVDVERALGLGPAQTARRIANFLRHYQLGPTGFRDLRNGRMLYVAATLMTSPRATTEGVAALVGYSSPTVLCRAFANAGLPSPGDVRRHVEMLR